MSWHLRAQTSCVINKLNHKYVTCIRSPEQFISNLTSRPTGPATTMNSLLGGLSVPPQRHLAAFCAPEIIITAAPGCCPSMGGQLLKWLTMLVCYLLSRHCWKSSWSVMWLNGMVALQQFNNFHNWGKHKLYWILWDLHKFMDITHYLWDESNCLTLNLPRFGTKQGADIL